MLLEQLSRVIVLLFEASFATQRETIRRLLQRLQLREQERYARTGASGALRFSNSNANAGGDGASGANGGSSDAASESTSAHLQQLQQHRQRSQFNMTNDPWAAGVFDDPAYNYTPPPPTVVNSEGTASAAAGGGVASAVAMSNNTYSRQSIGNANATGAGFVPLGGGNSDPFASSSALSPHPATLTQRGFVNANANAAMSLTTADPLALGPDLLAPHDPAADPYAASAGSGAAGESNPFFGVGEALSAAILKRQNADLQRQVEELQGSVRRLERLAGAYRTVTTGAVNAINSAYSSNGGIAGRSVGAIGAVGDEGEVAVVGSALLASLDDLEATLVGSDDSREEQLKLLGELDSLVQKTMRQHALAVTTVAMSEFEIKTRTEAAVSAIVGRERADFRRQRYKLVTAARDNLRSARTGGALTATQGVGSGAISAAGTSLVGPGSSMTPFGSASPYDEEDEGAVEGDAGLYGHAASLTNANSNGPMDLLSFGDSVDNGNNSATFGQLTVGSVGGSARGKGRKYRGIGSSADAGSGADSADQETTDEDSAGSDANADGASDGDGEGGDAGDGYSARGALNGLVSGRVAAAVGSVLATTGGERQGRPVQLALASGESAKRAFALRSGAAAAAGAAAGAASVLANSAVSPSSAAAGSSGAAGAGAGSAGAGAGSTGGVGLSADDREEALTHAQILAQHLVDMRDAVLCEDSLPRAKGVVLERVDAVLRALGVSTRAATTIPGIAAASSGFSSQAGASGAGGRRRHKSKGAASAGSGTGTASELRGAVAAADAGVLTKAATTGVLTGTVTLGPFGRTGTLRDATAAVSGRPTALNSSSTSAGSATGAITAGAGSSASASAGAGGGGGVAGADGAMTAAAGAVVVRRRRNTPGLLRAVLRATPRAGAGGEFRVDVPARSMFAPGAEGFLVSAATTTMTTTTTTTTTTTMTHALAHQSQSLQSQSHTGSAGAGDAAPTVTRVNLLSLGLFLRRMMLSKVLVDVGTRQAGTAHWPLQRFLLEMCGRSKTPTVKAPSTLLQLYAPTANARGGGYGGDRDRLSSGGSGLSVPGSGGVSANSSGGSRPSSTTNSAPSSSGGTGPSSSAAAAAAAAAGAHGALAPSPATTAAALRVHPGACALPLAVIPDVSSLPALFAGPSTAPLLTVAPAASSAATAATTTATTTAVTTTTTTTTVAVPVVGNGSNNGPTPLALHRFAGLLRDVVHGLRDSLTGPVAFARLLVVQRSLSLFPDAPVPAQWGDVVAVALQSVFDVLHERAHVYLSGVRLKMTDESSMQAALDVLHSRCNMRGRVMQQQQQQQQQQGQAGAQSQHPAGPLAAASPFSPNATKSLVRTASGSSSGSGSNFGGSMIAAHALATRSFRHNLSSLTDSPYDPSLADAALSTLIPATLAIAAVQSLFRSGGYPETVTTYCLTLIDAALLVRLAGGGLIPPPSLPGPGTAAAASLLAVLPTVNPGDSFTPAAPWAAAGGGEAAFAARVRAAQHQAAAAAASAAAPGGNTGGASGGGSAAAGGFGATGGDVTGGVFGADRYNHSAASVAAAANTATAALLPPPSPAAQAQRLRVIATQHVLAYCEALAAERGLERGGKDDLFVHLFAMGTDEPPAAPLHRRRSSAATAAAFVANVNNTSHGSAGAGAAATEGDNVASSALLSPYATGSISTVELRRRIAAVPALRSALGDDSIAALAGAFDLDGSGRLNPRQFARVFAPEALSLAMVELDVVLLCVGAAWQQWRCLLHAQLAELFAAADGDKDGQLGLDEFTLVVTRVAGGGDKSNRQVLLMFTEAVRLGDVGFDAVDSPEPFLYAQQQLGGRNGAGGGSARAGPVTTTQGLETLGDGLVASMRADSSSSDAAGAGDGDGDGISSSDRVRLPALLLVADRYRLGLSATATAPTNAGLQGMVDRVAGLVAEAAEAEGAAAAAAAGGARRR